MRTHFAKATITWVFAQATERRLRERRVGFEATDFETD